MTYSLILLVVALVLAIIAAFFEPYSRPWGRIHFGWLAFAFFVASFIKW